MQNTEITRIDEIKFLQFKIAENPIFRNPLTFSEVIDGVLHGKVSLEVSEDDGTKILDDSSIEKIKKVVPCLLKIVDKPRSFIKSLEEKVPVETAKRINFKAISQLSRDSNDWNARTLLSVHPKNVLSDVSEETIDLYENRFICTLTDRISTLLAQARRHYEDQIKELDEASARKVVQEQYHLSDRMPFYNKISKKHYGAEGDLSYREKAENEVETIQKLEKKICIIKRSAFYRTLHRKRKVSNPILRTNILIFEFNYNQAYKLWMYLNEIHKEDSLDLSAEIDTLTQENNYFLYCFLCMIVSLHDMGFAERTEGKIEFSNNVLSLSDSWVFDRNDKNKLVLSLTNHDMHFSYQFGNNQTDEFVLSSDFIDFEPMNRGKVDEYTRNLLNNFTSHLTANRKFKNRTSSQYALLSVDISRCAEETSFSSKVYRRFFNIGDNFSPDESPNDIANWGGYKTGMIIVTPVQLRNNFLRIERIINYHLVKHTDLSRPLDMCPLCGNERIRADGADKYLCYQCGHSISLTYCNNCDPEHKRPITWIKYLDDSFLKKPEIVSETFNLNEYNKITKIETIMGETATTSFELQQETNGGWKLKTICPYCGVRLGDKN